MADFTMIRGDTKIISLIPYRDDEPIELSEGDILHFRIFDNDEVIISKDVNSNAQDKDSFAIAITIDAADTQSIEIAKDRTYKWEAEIVFSDGTVLTPFYDREVIIKPDRITPDKRGDS